MRYDFIVVTVFALSILSTKSGLAKENLQRSGKEGILSQAISVKDKIGTSENSERFQFDVSNCDSVVTIICGQSMNGSTIDENDIIGNPAPDAVYQIQVDMYGLVNLSLCGSETGFDTYLRLYDACPLNSGNLIDANDDFCGIQSELELLLYPGTYWIVVEGYANSSGEYVLETSCSPCATVECTGNDEQEPNNGPESFGGDNTFTDINVLIDDVICGSTTAFNNVRDTDWFRFTINANDTWRFKCEPEEFDPRMYVLNSDLEIVFSVQEYGFCHDELLEATSLQPGSYYLWVGHNGFEGVPIPQDYRLSIERDDELLFSDLFNSAGSLPYGWTTQSNASVLTSPWSPIQESGLDWAIQTSQAAFSTPRVEWLISPIYNLTGYQDIELGYTHAYTHAGSTATVKYSTNGGVAWQNLTSYSSTTNGNIVTDIASWANGQANVRFAYVFTGTFVVGGASWRIDDFYLDGVATAPVASAPVPSQPPASWNILSGSVGCTWQHPLGVSGADLQVRIDANGDGDYLDGGAENWSEVADQPNASPLTFTTSVSYQQSGTHLCYEFRARSGQGLWGYSGSAGQEGIADDWYVRIVEEDNVPPTESVLFAGGSTNDSVTLLFSPTIEANFARYEIRCSPDSLVDESDLLWTDAQDPALAQIDTYQTTVTGLASGTVWYFRLWAVDLAGNSSPASNRVRKVTEGSQVSAVTDLQAELQGGDVLLTWTAPTTDIYGQSPVAIESYQVHASIDASFTPNPSTLIGTTGSTSHLIANPGGDIRSCFKVVVVGAGPGQPFTPVPMTVVPAGSFMMGQAGVTEPEHEVTLTHGFLLGTTEITNQQYMEAAQWAVDNGHATVSGNQLRAYGVVLLDLSSSYCEITFSSGQFGLRMAPGAGDWGFDNTSYDPSQHPVKMVSWYGAACYCDWLSLMGGLPAYYNGAWAQIPSLNNPFDAAGYRLPTEAEWELAAQYNDERNYPWGPQMPTCSLANFDNGGYCVGWTSPVGIHSIGAGSLGLQDMAGNLWEWNNDWHVDYLSGPQLNPVGPSSGSYRVFRGGSWFRDAAFLRCAYRGMWFPESAHFTYGFRLCKTLP